MGFNIGLLEDCVVIALAIPARMSITFPCLITDLGRFFKNWSADLVATSGPFASPIVRMLDATRRDGFDSPPSVMPEPGNNGVFLLEAHAAQSCVSVLEVSINQIAS